MAMKSSLLARLLAMLFHSPVWNCSLWSRAHSFAYSLSFFHSRTHGKELFVHDMNACVHFMQFIVERKSARINLWKSFQLPHSADPWRLRELSPSKGKSSKDMRLSNARNFCSGSSMVVVCRTGWLGQIWPDTWRKHHGCFQLGRSDALQKYQTFWCVYSGL